MTVKLRLARGGSKKRPFYRIVAADERAPRDGRYIERVGTYDPLLPKDSEARVKLDAERIQHWLAHGAKPTDRVLRFLDAAGILSRAPRNNPQKAEPGAKARERLEARQKAEAEAKAAPAEEPVAEVAAEEPVAEEPATEEPVAAEPAAEEPTAEEPAVEEPAADEPAAETPPADEPAAEEPVDDPSKTG